MTKAILADLLCIVALTGRFASHAAYIAEPEPDVVAFVQMTSVISGALSEDVDACKCLNWKEVYSTKVECEDAKGFEFYHEMYHVGAPLYLAKEHDSTFEGRCANYWQKLDDNICLNRIFESNTTDAWCWVSERCTSLNGGMTVPDVGLNAKICSASESLPASTTLQEMKDMAQKFNISAWSFLGKTTLPFSAFHKLWEEDGNPEAPFPEMEWLMTMMSGIPNATAIKSRKTSESDCSSFSTQNSDPCTCLNWKAVYACRVECHANAGYEFFNETHLRMISNGTHSFTLGNYSHQEALAIDYLGADRCANAFELMDNNYPLNADLVSMNSTWCWVSQDCADLRGGKSVPEVGLNAKLCGDAERAAHSSREVDALVQRFGAPGWLPLAELVLNASDYGEMLNETQTGRNVTPTLRAMKIQERMPYGLI